MVIYPDVEELIISYLKDTLLIKPGYSAVRIGHTKSKNDSLSEVIVTGSYNRDLSKVHRSASLVLEVYSDTYEKSSTLALIVDSLIREATVDAIKKVEVTVGPVRLAEASTSEKRSLSVDLVVKAASV
jgi:hypothetical protein